MAWIKLTVADPAVRVLDNGKIMWNHAARAIMGLPDHVEIYHDAETDKMGVRPVGYNEHSLAVLLNEDNDYQVNADTVLGELKPSNDYEATLNTPEPAPPEEPGDTGIFWWNIPA